MNSKANSGLLILIMIMSIFIGVVAGFLVSNGICNKKIADLEDELQFYYDEDDEEESEEYHRRRGEYGRPEKNETKNEVDNSTSNNEVTSSTVKVEDGEFVLQKVNLKDGDVITKRLNQNLEVKISITGPETDRHWTMAVNGNTVDYTGDQGYGEDALTFNFTDNYIFYTSFGTDIRQEELLVIDGNGKIIRTIYEMDKDTEGLVYFDASYGYNAVIVRASRRYHSGIVAPKYGTIPPIDGFGPDDIAKFPADLVIQALYVYKINADGTIDFDNPQVIVTETYKEFIQSMLNNSTEETEKTVAMRNWLNKNK